jgi:calcium binding protein 39
MNLVLFYLFITFNYYFFQAFHVFKIFVANPSNVEPVVNILSRNKNKIIKLLENFLPER